MIHTDRHTDGSDSKISLRGIAGGIDSLGHLLATSLTELATKIIFKVSICCRRKYIVHGHTGHLGLCLTGETKI